MLLRLTSSFRALMLMAALYVMVGAVSASAAALSVNRNFSDGMVIQRDQPVTITGTADKDAAVTVTFAGQTKSAKADAEGLWRVTLDAMPANKTPQSLTISSGGKTVKLDDVLVGDVILFARQTSIDVSLGKDEAGQAAGKAFKAPSDLRWLAIKTIPARHPQDDLAAEATSGWTAGKNDLLNLSAAAFYFGRDLADKTDVPIGIIDLNMGYAFPVGWLSREAQMETEKFYGRTDVPGNIKRMENLADLAAAGEPKPRKEVISSDPLKYALFPAGCYNAVLYPMRGLAVKTVLLQLGNDYPYMIYAGLEEAGTNLDRPELNRAYVETYNIRKVGFRMEPVTLPRIVREWRKDLAGDETPFGLIVPPGSALPTLGEHHREMRELQRQIADDNPAVGLILPGTEPVLNSAQPKDEKLMADRAVHWVLGSVYGKATPATGPMIDRVETDFNQATVYFREGTAEGLNDNGGGLEAFEVAGLDSEYAPAKAEIVGKTVRLSSDDVNRIVYVRYDWNSMPEQGLVNAAGLPAMPFRTEEKPYHWFVTNEESDLPEEYSTPANEWKGGDVTLVNGQLKTHGYPNFTGWLGPIGIKVGPFGPNMGVRAVAPGSPAAGKILVGDVIYSANGEMLTEDPQQIMAKAITHSESRVGAGKLVLGLRRDGKNIDVPVQLEVMGTYSSTAPYDCPKTDKIINQLEQWWAERGGPSGFLNQDPLFMLASGNPKYQGLVRRAVYRLLDKYDPNRAMNPTGGPKAWFPAHDGLLLGEYYMATGDRNVLPYLKWFCDRLAATQNPVGGWRHNFPGGDTYGLLPAIGVQAMHSFHFANQAGLKIDQEAYYQGKKFLKDGNAEMGFVIYGYGYAGRPAPPKFDPVQMNAGQISTSNGAIASAAIFFKLEGDTRVAHLCSLMSAFAWNTTFGGHGGNYWNNFWTPLGAKAHSREAYINFWKNYRWYREFNRMYDGSLIIDAQSNTGVAHGVALVAPRERLQITGAPVSPFSVDAPVFLKEAVVAYQLKNYAKCVELVDALIATGEIGKDHLPTVEYLGRAAREIQQSIEMDLTKVEGLIKDGKLYEASLDLPQLRGVVPDGNQRLAAIEKAIKADGASQKIAADRQRYQQEQKALVDVTKQKEEVTEPRQWQCLVTEAATGQSKKGEGKVPADQANVWRMKVVENLSQAPEDWVKPGFDDSSWWETNLPISWRMYHTVLLRTKFNVADKSKFDGLRFRAWLFRQQGIEIYLNGELVGKVNNLEKKTGNVDAEFKDSALKHLRNGENTLAVTSRHNWRWGMLFMRVYNDGFGFMLDGRLKQD
jgi:hypothetical protein